MSRVLTYDIETTDLKADGGTTLCIGYKFLDEPETHIIAINDYKGWNKTPANLLDDSKVWRDFMKVFNTAELTVGYFNSNFDRPYMYSKLLKHGLEIPANIPNIDLFYTVKSNMSLSRKSMDNVTRYLELQDELIHKTPVSYETWLRGSVGDPAAIEAIKEHCRADLFLTERLYLKLRPLIRTHPRVAGYLQCRHCGSDKLTAQGKKLTVTKGDVFQFKCKECGGWMSVTGEKNAAEIKRASGE